MSGKIVVGKNANRPGTELAPVLTTFLDRVAGTAGTTLHVGTGTNHNRLTVDGRVSDHFDGHAADIPVSVDSHAGDVIAASALVSAGVPAKRAAQMAKSGGLWTINRGGYRIQVIWRTDQGGNHHDHVHVGVRKIG